MTTLSRQSNPQICSPGPTHPEADQASGSNTTPPRPYPSEVQNIQSTNQSHPIRTKKTYIGNSTRPLGEDIQHIAQSHSGLVGRYDPSLFEPFVGWELEVVEDCSLEEIDDRVFGDVGVFWAVAVGRVVISYVHGGEAGLVVSLRAQLWEKWDLQRASSTLPGQLYSSPISDTARLTMSPKIPIFDISPEQS
jgi:hypothetical protein